jgi:hypothetical protein
MVETVGIEPTSRNNDTYASTSVVTVLAFRQFFCPVTGVRTASLINLFLRSQTESNRRSPLRVSSSTYHMGDGGWNRRVLLGSYCEVVVFFASYRLWRFNEADPLDSQHKHDLSLSNPKRPHVIKLCGSTSYYRSILFESKAQNICALDFLL